MKTHKFFGVVLGIGLALSSVGVVSAADLIEADESFAMPNDDLCIVKIKVVMND